MRWLMAVMVLLCGAAQTYASTPAGRTIETRVVTPVPAALARALATAHPSRHVLRSIAIDLDRDGDLDVIASTAEELLVVWLNDGLGHLVAEQPGPSPWLRATGLLMQSTAEEAVMDDQLGPERLLEISASGSSTCTESPTARLDSPDAASPLETARDPHGSRGPPMNFGV
jgi:hypothetical protein